MESLQSDWLDSLSRNALFSIGPPSQENPKRSQTAIADITKKELNLDKLTQATVSTIYREFQAAAATNGNLTMEQCL